MTVAVSGDAALGATVAAVIALAGAIYAAHKALAIRVALLELAKASHDQWAAAQAKELRKTEGLALVHVLVTIAGFAAWALHMRNCRNH